MWHALPIAGLVLIFVLGTLRSINLGILSLAATFIVGTLLTRESLAALLDARSRAKARGIYADSSLSRGGYSFLDNDSAAVLARTGKWLSDWLETLPPH